MTDTTNANIDATTQMLASILADTAPIAAAIPGGQPVAAGEAIAMQAIPALGMLAKMIYAMFHLNHIAAQQASSQQQQ